MFFDRESCEFSRIDDGISIRVIREIRDPVPAFLSSRLNNLPNRRSAVPEWAAISSSFFICCFLIRWNSSGVVPGMGEEKPPHGDGCTGGGEQWEAIPQRRQTGLAFP